ncbi:MAG: DUF4962 domain-containing protein [Kiritimatiellia bacterium]|nr:DUF4962 domain-containing protein [Kiritimatiellia bacterium]
MKTTDPSSRPHPSDPFRTSRAIRRLRKAIQGAVLFPAFWAAWAAEPLSLSNRPATEDEWGYRPVDGSRVALNPPSFTWMHEESARTYDLQWSEAPTFLKPKTVEGFRWNAYTHEAPQSVGTWYWRYRYRDARGQTSNWSQVRKVIVGPEAILFPMPTVKQQRERIPAGHPRLFMRPEELPRLRALAAGREAERFAALKKRADEIIQDGPTPEPEHRGSARDKDDKEAIRYWWPNRVQTDKAGEEAELLAFVYLMTGDPHYGQAARRWILHLASWDPDGPTQFRLNCEAGKAFLYRMARAYDWAWDTLDEADRIPIRAVMRRRVSDAWESWELQRGVGLLTRPYNSHGNRIWHKVAEVGIAFLGEIPDAETWVDFAVNKFFASYPVWSDDDGGWHEGLHYWYSYTAKAVSWLLVAQKALAIDGFKKPFYTQTSVFPLYLAPPHSPNRGFGDLSATAPHRGWGGLLDFLVRTGNTAKGAGRAAELRWWKEEWGMPDQAGVFGFIYAANLPEMPAARPPAGLPPSKVFRGIGVASLHTSLLDSRNDIHFLFKSSPFGRRSHGHNPQNSFQLNAYAEALLTTCVYRDLHGSRFHYEWAHSTQAHNAVLVNGEGQIPRSPLAQGKILAFDLQPGFDYVLGDATQAYAAGLKRGHRHVLFVKEPDPYVLIFDDLQTEKPSTFQFMLHAFGPFDVDEAGARLTITRPRAGAAVLYLPESPLSFRQWDGYDPPPAESFPNQWHVEAGTTRKSSRIALLTVIVPYRAGEAPQIRARRIESDTAVGAEIEIGGKIRRAAFRKPGVKGEARLIDRVFEGACANW